MTPQPRMSQPRKALSELLSKDGDRVFTITEKQFFGIVNGWTHLELMDEKSIFESIYDTRSGPAPLTQNDTGNCLVICQHCGKVTQVKCADAVQAREKVLDALDRDWKGRYVEDAVAEIRRFPASLRTGGEPR